MIIEHNPTKPIKYLNFDLVKRLEIHQHISKINHDLEYYEYSKLNRKSTNAGIYYIALIMSGVDTTQYDVALSFGLSVGTIQSNQTQIRKFLKR